VGTTADELRRDLDQDRANLTNDLQAIGDRVSPGRMVDRRKAATRQRFADVRERVMGSAEHMQSRAGSTAGDMRDTASGAMSSVTGAVREAPERAERMVEGNPLGAGIAAFGLGLVIATLMPETATEQRLVAKVEPKLQDAASQVGSAAQEVVEAVKPAATEAVGELKDEAKQAANQLKEQGRGAVSETTNQAKETAQDMRTQVQQ